MRDCNVQGAGVPDGAIYKEVVVIGTFFLKKKKNVDFACEIAWNLFSVWFYIFELGKFFFSLHAVKVWKYSSTHF